MQIAVDNTEVNHLVLEERGAEIGAKDNVNE